MRIAMKNQMKWRVLTKPAKNHPEDENLAGMKIRMESLDAVAAVADGEHQTKSH